MNGAFPHATGKFGVSRCRLAFRCRFSRALSCVPFFIAFGVAGCAVIEETPLTTAASASESSFLASLAPLPHARAATDAASNERLSEWLKTYLKDEYEIVDRRFYAVDREDFLWVGIAKFVGNSIEQPLGACVERQPWHDPGYDLVQVWRVPSKPYTRIAVAVANDETAERGDRVVGYFELKRTEASRGPEALEAERTPCPSTIGAPNG